MIFKNSYNIFLNVYLKIYEHRRGFGSPKLVNNTTAEYIYIAKLTAIMGFFHWHYLKRNPLTPPTYTRWQHTIVPNIISSRNWISYHMNSFMLILFCQGFKFFLLWEILYSKVAKLQEFECEFKKKSVPLWCASGS